MDKPTSITPLLHHLAAVTARESDQILQEQLGVGFAQYKIMSALQANPKVKQRQIAYNLGQTEASISRQIKLLHKKDMLLTKINPRSRRERLTMLTSKGLKVLDAANKALASYHQTFLSTLSQKQQETLLKLLTSVRQA